MIKNLQQLLNQTDIITCQPKEQHDVIRIKRDHMLHMMNRQGLQQVLTRGMTDQRA